MRKIGRDSPGCRPCIRIDCYCFGARWSRGCARVDQEEVRAEPVQVRVQDLAQAVAVRGRVVAAILRQRPAAKARRAAPVQPIQAPPEMTRR